jgi:hypothetical protein
MKTNKNPQQTAAELLRFGKSVVTFRQFDRVEMARFDKNLMKALPPWWSYIYLESENDGQMDITFELNLSWTQSPADAAKDLFMRAQAPVSQEEKKVTIMRYGGEDIPFSSDEIQEFVQILANILDVGLDYQIDSDMKSFHIWVYKG